MNTQNLNKILPGSTPALVPRGAAQQNYCALCESSGNKETKLEGASGRTKGCPCWPRECDESRIY
jgi:hypothetical protein